MHALIYIFVAEYVLAEGLFCPSAAKQIPYSDFILYVSLATLLSALVFVIIGLSVGLLVAKKTKIAGIII